MHFSRSLRGRTVEIRRHARRKPAHGRDGKGAAEVNHARDGSSMQRAETVLASGMGGVSDFDSVSAL